MTRTGRVRVKKKGYSRFWLYLCLIAILFFAGYLAGGVFQAYGESEPVINPEDEPSATPEPSPGGGEKPVSEPPRVEFPPPEGEIWRIAGGNYLEAAVTRQTTLGQYAPADLERVPDEYITLNQRQWDYFLRSEALEHLIRMIEAARAEGVELFLNSAYRSYDTQQKLFHDYAAAYGEEEADTFSARPGHSEHQLGTTVDFEGTITGKYHSLETVTYNDLDGVLTAAGWWLAKNAHRYGFAMSYPPESKPITGYTYEPWHFRYIGAEAARAWYESGEVLCLFLLHRYPQELIKPGERSTR